MPTLHPREKLIREAERDLRKFLIGWVDKFEGLTAFESIQVLQNTLGDEILSICKYGIRIERHGDTETPGGLSKE